MIEAASRKIPSERWEIKIPPSIPSPAPIPKPMASFEKNSDAAVKRLTSPPWRIVTMVMKMMAPVVSLKADSLSITTFRRSLTLTCLRIGIRVAGSVGAIITPNSKAAAQGRSGKIIFANPPTINVERRTPGIARSAMIQT